MNKSVHTAVKAAPEKLRAVDSVVLANIVKAFRPDEIGLGNAWNEFYLACQAAEASHDLLRAIHDVKESIEDVENV